MKIFQYEKKICRICKMSRKDLMKSTKSSNRQYYICRDCQKERMRRYASTDSGRDKINTAKRDSYRRYPEKNRARASVHHAIKVGLLVKPQYCEGCGLPALLESHHEDYSKQLEVQWLCRSCHSTKKAIDI
jgi:transposase-like protein